MDQKIKIISNEKCWMEHTALQQLEQVGNLPRVTRAVGLPDLHAGKGPVGIAVETEGMIYPHLIGNDIGCGMGLFATNCALRKYKQERFVTKLNHIRMLEDLPVINPYDEESPIYRLGTIGGGNHFAEFQKVESIEDEAAAAALNLDQEKLLLLIHCGSRDYGQRILSQFVYDKEGLKGLQAGTAQAQDYQEKQENALLWARRNRQLVAEKLMDYLGYEEQVTPLVDVCHNFLEQKGGRFIHRKGATSAQQGPVLIPGSRGNLTYLVMPAEDTDLSLHSLAHGAGRKWARSLCKSRIKDKYDRDTIRQSALGSRTVCHDTELLYQEAPEAYKNITHVMDALLSHGLCRVIATLRPLITYKG